MTAAAAGEVALRWQRVGLLSEIPRMGAKTLEHPEGRIAVFRTADDQVFALNDACPHRGGPLSQGIVSGCRVYCPLHDWCIELDSGQAVAPDEGLTGTLATRVDDNVVFVAFPA